MKANSETAVLVTGATGKVGRRLTERLRSAGHDVRPASRKAAVPFDWFDRSTWAPALEGVEAVYIVPPDEPFPVDEFVAQAVESGVRRLVSQSGRGLRALVEAVDAPPETVGVYAAQHAVQHSGVEWTVLQPNNFNQNFSEGDYRDAVLAGELVLPLEGVAEPFIDVDDIAAVAAAVLTEDGHHGRIYELSGPEAITFAEAMRVISDVSELDVAFRSESHEAHLAALSSAGVPELFVRFLDAMYQIMREGALAEVADGVRAVLGREPVAFADWAAGAAEAWSSGRQ
ncbi:NAD(P)H-binding protein [Glycomyces tenuis]|uniref:NAD(P)H-binding protein n=1 Tax=Glycomyces tenuis TaxID=58116 RepID=UPI00040B2E7E|nr:NAD(P)H-binding protein [Glycomyces tenuis]